jgi:polar amino acid transport system substrate-binding protein
MFKYFAFIFCTLFSVFAHSELKPLHMGYGDINHYPFEYMEDGEMKGLHVDLINIIANQLGYQVEHKRYPWRRILKMTKNGSLDGVSFIGGVNTELNYFYFDDNLGLSSNGFYPMVVSAKADKHRFRGDLSELEGLKVAIIRGYNLITQQDKANGLNFIEVDYEDQLYAMLKTGRVDVALVMRSQLLKYQRGELDGFKVFRRPFLTFWVDIGFVRKKFSPEFAASFSSAVQQFWTTPEYFALQRKYQALQKSGSRQVQP